MFERIQHLRHGWVCRNCFIDLTCQLCVQSLGQVAPLYTDGPDDLEPRVVAKADSWLEPDAHMLVYAIVKAQKLWAQNDRAFRRRSWGAINPQETNKS